MKFIKCEKGMALPLTMMIFLVLGLLGAAIWHYSISELNQSSRDERITMSYYLARAGAESLALEIMVNSEILELVPQVDDKVEFGRQSFQPAAQDKLGEYEVIMERVSSRRVIITGIGYVSGSEQRVSVYLETMEAFDGLVYSKGSLDFNENATVTGGDIASGGKITWSGNSEPPVGFEYNLYEDTVIEFPDQPFPEPQEQFPPPDNILNIDDPNDPHLITISPVKAYSKIQFANNRKGMIVDATGNTVLVETSDFDMPPRAGKLELVTGSGNDLILIVDNITLRDVQISGNGIAYLYVRESITVQTPHSETNIIGEGAEFIVYLAEGATMTFVGNSQFEGLIYGPKASVAFDSNVKFEGAMIVEQLVGSFDGNVTIGGDDAELRRKFIWSMLEELGFGEYLMVRWES